MAFSEVSAKTSENVEKTMNEFIVRTAKRKAHILPLKEIYMTFLLRLNEDFDDDLLFDAISILEVGHYFL